MNCFKKLITFIGILGLLCVRDLFAAPQLPINPIVPTQGEQVLLDIVKSLPLNDIRSALDHFPVPYVVVASANGAPPNVSNNKAGSPSRIDADGLQLTGTGGQDIQVEVNTELSPVYHLRVNINRLGSAPFAQNVKVLIAFPWRAFNTEALPGDPNLFIGYTTAGALTSGGYPAGGNAPATTEINFYPNVVGGLDHNFQVAVTTTGAANPVRFIAGHFDGTNVTGILNSDGQSILADPVPANFSIALGVHDNPLSASPTALMASQLDLTWSASAPAKVSFDYIENESAPTSTIFDYNSSLTFAVMPTNAHLILDLNEAANQITLTQTANAAVGAMTGLFQRNDRLTITYTATDVPTATAVTLRPSGCIALNVNANTLDLDIIAVEDRGFAGTQPFFGRRVKYAEAKGVDLPDLSGCYSPGNSVSLQATNAGESIPLVELTIATNHLNVQKPPVQPDGFAPVNDPNRHIFSLIDDGIDGTGFARMVNLVNATYDLTTAPPKSILQRFTYNTSKAAPLTAYFKNQTPSPLISHPPDNAEATCNLEDIPAGGPSKITLTYPTELDLDIDPLKSLHCFGIIDSLEFDLDAGDIPEKFKYKFDPYGSLTILSTYKDLVPNKAKVGHLAVRLTDVNGLPNALGTDLIGLPLKNARARVDDMYSFVATWADGPNGSGIHFNTGQPDAVLYAGGAQIDVSTIVNRTHLPAAAPTSDDYLTYTDGGPGQDKEIAAGVFGIDEFTYQSSDAGTSRNVVLTYAANADHRLVAKFDTRKGGRFFPGMDIKAGVLTIDKIPSALLFSTDLSGTIGVVASNGIDQITMTGDITINNDTTHIDTLASKIPKQMSFVLHDQKEGSVELTTTGTIDELKFDLQSDSRILSEVDYKHLFGDVRNIPANFQAHWGSDPSTHVDVMPSQSIGFVRFIVSALKASEDGGEYSVFTTPGSDVEHTPFARQIDVNYFKAGPDPTPPTREQLYINQRVDPLYQTTIQLGNGEDHAAVRKNSLGDTEFIGFQLTGVKSFKVEVPKDEAKGTLEVAQGGTRPFYAGVEIRRDVRPVLLASGNSAFYQTDALDDTTQNFVPGQFNQRPGFQAYVDIPDQLPYWGSDGTTFGANNLINPLFFFTSAAGLKVAVDRFDVMSSSDFSVSKIFSKPKYTANTVQYGTISGFNQDFLKGLTIEVGRIDVYHSDFDKVVYGPDSLVDQSHNFATNSLRDLFIESNGESHKIAANSGGAIQLVEPWVNVPAGNVFTIFGGPQTHLIASNKDDLLTLSDNWFPQVADGMDFQIYRPDEEQWIVSSSGSSVTLLKPWKGHVPLDGTSWRMFRRAETHSVLSNTSTKVTLVSTDPFADSVPPPPSTPYKIYKKIEVGNFVTAEIPSIPGKTVFDVSSSEPSPDSAKAFGNLTFSESPGRLLVYKGELPRARDGSKAMKLVIPTTPTSVQFSFDADSSGGLLGLPQGSMQLHVNSPTELRLLNQSPSSRMLGAVIVQDFDASWGTKEFQPEKDCNFNPLNGAIGCDFSLVLASFHLDGTAGPGLQGFFNLYGVDTTPHFFINTNVPAPRGSGEYVPAVTLLTKDLTKVHLEAGIRACISLKIPPNSHCSPLPDLFHTEDVTGSINFDLWDQGGGPGGILGNEDYVENNPYHLVPFPHSFASHLTPLAP